jgi:hypothetical protein
MSAKNRALGLAIATAALVGFSAPMASAATIAGPSNSGFNNDSILNLSNNQIPVQTCTFGGAVNTAPLSQAITGVVTGTLGANTGDLTATQGTTCTNGATQNNSSSTTTGGSSMGAPMGTPSGAPAHSWSNNNSGPSNSGFNNDSILNLSGNQVPIQTCTFGALSNAASILQTIAPVAAPLVAPTDVLDATTGDVNGSQTAGCAQTPSQTQTSSLSS